MECSLIKRVCWFFLLVGGITQANAEQGCPYPSSVKYVSGYFQASDKQSHWRSPKVDADDFADRFIGALFTPGQGKDRENGYLDRCVYRMGSGRSLALRYDMPGALSTMSLTKSLHWELATDPLEQDVYICQDSQPDNCAFTVGRQN